MRKSRFTEEQIIAAARGASDEGPDDWNCADGWDPALLKLSSPSLEHERVDSLLSLDALQLELAGLGERELARVFSEGVDERRHQHFPACAAPATRAA
jgi:hypothetical protein